VGSRDLPIRPTGDGTYRLDLGTAERDLVRSLTSQLRTLLTTSDSPALQRLFPPPYGDDAERNAGYAALAGPELVEARLAALDVVERTLDADEVDADDLEAWMRSINDVRLVLGTVLEITDDGEPPQVGDDNAATFAAYEFLGALLDLVVEVLAEDL
jgi:hypothetical protein